MNDEGKRHAARSSHMVCAIVWLAAACVLPAAAGELRNFTPDQASTLQAIARDLFLQTELSAADFERCILQLDASASSEHDQEGIAGAMDMVEGALRRMGYRRYEDISDQDERVRMARMFAERQWMRGFRASMERCLTGTGAQ